MRIATYHQDQQSNAAAFKAVHFQQTTESTHHIKKYNKKLNKESKHKATTKNKTKQNETNKQTKIQAHERFKRKLFINTKNKNKTKSMQVFGVVPFIKLQSDT